MPLTSVRVPAPLAPAFELAQSMVRRSFADLVLRPEEGTIRIGGERYVLVRADSLYLGWFTALSSAFGQATAAAFIYGTARTIGRNDCDSFSERLGLDEGLARLATGPVHFAHAGWGFVDIFADSAPASDETFFLHYSHPNTFETEVLRTRGATSDDGACLFSAGYSAGWCSAAFGVELHAREIRCVARGEACCEFVMATEAALDGHQQRLAAR